MKQPVKKRKPSGIVDSIALAFTTWGVGYIRGAPGTYGSAIGVAIYLAVFYLETPFINHGFPLGIFLADIHWAFNYIVLVIFVGLGIWASNHSIPLLGNDDPPEAVVDEVMGQLITFCFIPLGLGWPFILAGFLLFRIFDIWKPYPINNLQILPGGLGICVDDIVAGVYAGVCLAIGHAIYLAL